MPGRRKQLVFENKDLWYFVGLIAADGNLSSDGRHIDITAKDPLFLEELKKSLGLQNKIGSKRNGRGIESFHIQFANRDFYDFLLSIGLTPKKSLTLGELKVPYQWFQDFLRGVIDGDGCIRNWTHPTNGKEQWSLRVYSASPSFLKWLKLCVEKSFFVKGQIHHSAASTLVLKFGKLAAKQILKKCYYEGCLSLDRKTKLAQMCCASGSGWGTSKTLLCVS